LRKRLESIKENPRACWVDNDVDKRKRSKINKRGGTRTRQARRTNTRPLQSHEGQSREIRAGKS
jgi:hypothetical protein